MSDIERKQVSFHAQEVKQDEVNGVPIGRVNGLGATFQEDRGGDVIVPGAFKETIERHRRDNRPVRMMDQHYRGLMGGFPIANVAERSDGLYVEGEINLEVQRGKEAYALARQGVLTDFSIGFSCLEDEVRNNIRYIKKLDLWEISLVAEPMNPGAKISEVKERLTFENLPLASVVTPWEPEAAKARVAEFTQSEGEVKSDYRRAFFWYDGAKADEFSGYELPFVDVVDGELKAVPRGIFAALDALQEIPEDDQFVVAKNISSYYEKMGLDSPLPESFKIVTLKDIESLDSIRELEALLKSTRCFSRKAIDTMAHFVKSYQGDPDTDCKAGDPPSELKYGTAFYSDAVKELNAI